MAATLPPHLASLQLTSGSYRAGMKLLITGRSKTGKSFFAASAPPPILALACGEPGIIPYLDPARGDVGLEIYTPEDYYAAIEFACTHEKDFATIVIDNDNLAWAQTLEHFEEDAGRELKGTDWRKIKGPRKAALRKLMRSRLNVVMTCWLKDVIYTTEDAPPGVEGKTKLLPQENPDAEKNVPYAVDLIFQTDVVRDKLFKPTSKHTVTFIGGRRPRTVSPEELFTGKVWPFDARKPVNVWDTVIKPFQERWVEGGVDHLGVDPLAAGAAREEMEDAYQQQEVGRLLALIKGVQTIDEYKQLGKTEEVAVNQLTGTHKELVMASIKAKKGELKV